MTEHHLLCGWSNGYVCDERSSAVDTGAVPATRQSMQPSPSKRRSLSRIAVAVALLSTVAACGTVLLNDRGSLTRYDG